MNQTCLALSTPDTKWNFCPSFAASAAFTALFALATLVQLVQGIYYRKVYSIVIIMSGLWQTAAYLVRDLSIKHPANSTLYIIWFVLILCAPLWTNAYVYMITGRMVWNFTAKAKVLGVTAWRFGTYFVIFDIIAFFVQIYGAVTATRNGNTTQQTLTGLHIYMGGVGLQQFFIIIFAGFAYKFHRMLLKEEALPKQELKRALTLLYTLYAVLTLITVRIIFRLTEYASGLDSTIPNHEIYQYLLDSTPMLIAIVLLSIVHPGRIMPGKQGNIPGRKERKRGVTSKLQTQWPSQFEPKPWVSDDELVPQGQRAPAYV